MHGEDRSTGRTPIRARFNGPTSRIRGAFIAKIPDKLLSKKSRPTQREILPSGQYQNLRRELTSMKAILMTLALSLFVSGMSSHAEVGFDSPKLHKSLQQENVVPLQRLPFSLRTLSAGSNRWTPFYTQQLPIPLVTAQAGKQTQQSRVYSMADGFNDGRVAAEGRGTAGSFVGGFACGFFTGLIGTGILWGVTGGDDVPIHLMGSSVVQEKGSNYSMGFSQGYKERTKQKKRGARLGGGLLGSATILILIISN